ncbi:hypothetical protein M758_6G170000 [Ceratodon purpureus]|nr:hypothetical protein M758_6G170000 [Ceratodon purpureus]
MTGIFQIFDRYKSKSYARNDRRKSNSGESEIKAIPKYYLVEEDGVARKVVPDQSDRQSRPEASRDSRRPSSADVGEVVVKSLTSSKESQTGIAQKPHSARPSIDSQKSSLSGHKSSSPRESQKEIGGFKDPSKNPENYSSDAVTPKPTVPSRSSVDHRSRDVHKLPPRDTRSAPKSSTHRDRSRASVENVQEVSAHLDDARDISRAILQMREAAKSPYDGREARRHSPSVTRKDHVQRNHSSGDEREGEKYHRDGRRYQSSGDEKDAHRHHMPSDSREGHRYSSVTENYGEQAYDDEKDHHRPQFPSEGKDFLRSWHRNPPTNHVKDMPRYMSSGDEMDRRSNLSSGDEKGAHRFCLQSERWDGNRHRGSHDQESNRSFWPVDRDGQRYHSAGDGFDGLRDESSGDERVAQRPPSSARRRHHQGSADERGHKYYSSRERGDGRRHAAYDAGRDSSQGLHSSGDERSAHRHTKDLHTKDLHRRHSSAYYAGHRHQTSAAEVNEHQRYQSAGEDQVGYRHHASSAKASRHQPSTSGYEGRRYQSSGDERGGAHRSFVPAGARAGGQRHDPSLHTYNSWQNESSDDDREVFLQQNLTNGREDARRSSNATDAHRRYSLGNEDGHRHSSSNDDRRRDRSRSSVRDASKYESAVDTRGVTGEYQNVRSNDRHGEWGYEEATVAPSLPIPAVAKDGHRRNSSVESRGEHRRRGSNSSVISSKDSLKLHLSGEKARLSNSKDKESSSVYSRDLPPRSSRSHSSLQVSPRNMTDMRDLARLNVQVRESSQTPALRDGFRTESQKSLSVPDSSLLSPKSMTGSYDFREMLKQIDFKDSQWTSEKFGVGSSRNSIDGRDPPRTSNVSRASVDSRQYQTSTPRLSVDGREHLRASSLHSSRASSVDAQVQLRTNSMDSSTSGEFKRRGPSVVARLMGLAELPEKDTPLPSSDRPQGREGKSLQKLLNTPPAEAASPPSDRAKSQLHLSEVAQQMKQVAARLHQDSQLRQKSVQVQQETRPKRKSKAKSRTQSRSRSPPPAPPPKEKDARSLSQHQGYGIYGRQIDPGSPLPRQPMSPKHHHMEGMPNVFKKRASQDHSSGDLDQRLHQLRIKNSIQEHRTLKQILEAMHLKGLLHPPQKKLPKSPRAEFNEHGYLKEEAERPLHDFESKPSSSASNVARANRNDYQEQVNFEDMIRMDGEMHEEPVHDIDHSGEASIVVMKPVSYHSAIPPSATKEIDVNSESAAVSGFEREKIEIGHRRRGSERRAGSSGKISRSHSLEPPEQRSSDKAQVEDLSFANVMLSWRERIAADAAKKATVEVAEVKSQSRSKSSALKHRSQDVSPLKYGGSIEKRFGSPRVQESLEEYLSKNREEYDSGSRKILSDIAQENANHDEEKFKIVGRSKSDLQLSAHSVETLAAMEASLDRVPAQVAVLRSKRSSGKTSRSKEKLRASHPGGLRSKSSALPSSSNFETCSLTDELVQDPHLQDLTPIKFMSPIKVMSPIKITSLSADSKVQGECTTTPSLTPSLKDSDDSSRMTPKKRKIVEPAVVLEEMPQLPAVATIPEVEVPVSSNDEDDYAQVGELLNLQFTPAADCDAEEPQDAKMEDAFDEDTAEAHTPEGFASGRDKCFSEDGAFTLQGADHPSPVSVLDSPIFQEGFHLEELSTSPDSAKSSMLRHEDAEDTLQREVAVAYEQEAESLTPKSRASKEALDPLRDIYTKVARSLELGEKDAYRGQPIADLQIPTSENAAALISGDRSKGRLYVEGILMESGLVHGASPLPEDAAEIMEFDVFTRKEEELQTAELERIDRGELEKSEEKRYKESLDRRLIFDCMNEILERKMSPFQNPQPWGAPVIRRRPCGQHLVDEVWNELKDMHWPTTVAYDALYAVLQKDFMRKGFQWLDFSVEVGEVGCELEQMILLELVEECVHDVASIKPKPAKLQHLINHALSPSPCEEASYASAPPSPSAPSEAPSEMSQAPSEMSQAPSEVSAVSSDDSERRRRELLDKTRRDLLAWHVQYQQL